MGLKISDLNKLPPIILASASPRRERLLKEVGLRFLVIPSAVNEPELEYLTPEEQALFHAFRKANVVSRNYPDHLVIGVDTIVCLNGRIFGKPASIEEAKLFLKELSGKTHQVISGVCLKLQAKNRCDLFYDITEVDFYELDDAKINLYFSYTNPLDKAGAYGIQDRGNLIVKEIRGSLYNVIGLPMEKLLEKLNEFTNQS
ncbi:MAG: Maf family protein [Verrucomicrobiia bacterium]|jgi:septum formation protein